MKASLEFGESMTRATHVRLSMIMSREQVELSKFGPAGMRIASLHIETAEGMYLVEEECRM